MSFFREIHYQYNTVGLIDAAVIIFPDKSMWRINYIYSGPAIASPLLKKADVFDSGGVLTQHYHYERSAGGQLIRKRIEDVTGVEIGHVLINYDLSGRITKIDVTAPASLVPPAWDPLVDQ